MYNRAPEGKTDEKNSCGKKLTKQLTKQPTKQTEDYGINCSLLG